MTRFLAFLPGVLALFSLLAPPLQAQPEPAAAGEPEEFFGVIDVEIVNIDVWVSDGRGQPVPGLTRENFVVTRDGSPVEISNFYAVFDGRPKTSGAAEPEPAAPDPGEATAEPPAEAAPLAEEHRLWLIVYIDNYNIDPVERDRVLPSVAEFLERSLRPSDRAMIVTFDRSLEVQQPFTDNLGDLFATLVEVSKQSGHAVIRRRERMDTLQRIDRARSSSIALSYARQYADEQMNAVGYTTDALERLIETLAGLPGRKALIHISSGIPMLAGEEMFHAIAERFETSEPYGEIPRHDTTRDFERITRLANSHRIVFNTLDAGGLRGFEFGSAEYGGFKNPNMRRTLDSVVPENLQSPLRFVAAETGGRALLNRNDSLKALRELIGDFRSFYSLGISATGADSGRYHKIDVKLRERGDGWRIRHRAGYQSQSLDARVRTSLRSALLYDHQTNPLGVGVGWGDPVPHGEGNQYLLPIELRVPLRDTVLLPVTEGSHEARLRLFLAAVGEDGAVSEIQVAPLGFRLSDQHVEAAKEESLLHTHRLLLSRGRKKVGVAVLDLFGLQASVLTGYVQAGPPEQAQ